MDNNQPLLTFIMNVSFYILLLILLILWIIAIIHRRYIIFRNRQAIIGPITATTSTNLGPHGLDTSVIDTLPKFTYSRYEQDFSAKLTSECAVCLGVFEEKETLRMLPKCGHVFHADCVDTWLRMHATCPFCRDVLSENNPVTGEGPTSVDVVINVNDDRER